MQFGGEQYNFLTDHPIAAAVITAVLLLILLHKMGWINVPFFETMFLLPVQPGKFDRNILDYDADFRGGVNTRPFDERELTNILLDARRVGDPIEICSKQFDSYRPGVDRNLVSQLVNSECVRAHADRSGQENWRESSDKVMQQFGNTGTVINNKTNPLMNAAPIKVPIGGDGMVRK